MDSRRMPQYFSKSKPIHWTVGIMDMPDELFHKILRYIMHERVVPIDSRSSLSLDSFQPPPPSSSPEDAATIGKFKCVCKRWRELALEHQFTHIDTLATWGERSFSRLECFQRGDDPFTGEPNLAAKVTKFSLKVPVFYPQSMRSGALGWCTLIDETTGEEQFSRLLGRTRDSIQNARQQLQAMLRTSTVSNSRHRNATNQVRRELHQLIDDEKLMIDIMTRARDQQRTTTSGRDLQVLQQALSAFTSLRHIVLMSVWDATDGEWQKYLGKHRELADAFTPEWSDHGTRTLASAYQASGCTATRVSSRFMDAQIPMSLTNGSEEALARLAVRMTTLRLELRFNRPEQLENKMFQLSPLFRKVFEAAINLQAVHIEFTKQAKVSIPLETVFHDVRWPRIRVIGVAHWRLNSDEIIDLVRRHRRTLKGLRLRDVYLKSGSRWDDILRVVRSEMKILGWLSLTRSNYEAWEDSHTPLVGFPVNDSDDVSDESYEEDEVEDENSAEPADYSSDSEMSDEIDMEYPNGEQGDDSDTSSDDYDHHEGSDSESDAGTAVYDTSMEEQVQRHPLPLQCHCHRGYEPTADLHDDGVQVTKDQRIYWQQWVVGRCRIHDPQV